MMILTGLWSVITKVLSRVFWQKKIFAKRSKNGLIWPIFWCHIYVTPVICIANGKLKSTHCHHNAPGHPSHIRQDVQKIWSHLDDINLEKKIDCRLKMAPSEFLLIFLIFAVLVIMHGKKPLNDKPVLNFFYRFVQWSLEDTQFKFGTNRPTTAREIHVRVKRFNSNILDFSLSRSCHA